MLALLLIWGCTQPPTEAPEPGPVPTLLVTVSGLSGAEASVVPWLEALRAQGTTFTNAWSGSPAPLPTLRLIHGGELAHAAHPIHSNPAAVPLASRMASAGFRSVAITSDATTRPGFGLEAGFETYITRWPEHTQKLDAVDAAWVVSQAEQECLTEQPVFCWVHFADLRTPEPETLPAALQALANTWIAAHPEGILVLTSDHAETHLTGRLSESTNVALIVVGPGFEPGTSSQRPVSVGDISLTLAPQPGTVGLSQGANGWVLQRGFEDHGTISTAGRVRTHGEERQFTPIGRLLPARLLPSDPRLLLHDELHGALKSDPIEVQWPHPDHLARLSTLGTPPAFSTDERVQRADQLIHEGACRQALEALEGREGPAVAWRRSHCLHRLGNGKEALQVLADLDDPLAILAAGLQARANGQVEAAKAWADEASHRPEVAREASALSWLLVADGAQPPPRDPVGCRAAAAKQLSVGDEIDPTCVRAEGDLPDGLEILARAAWEDGHSEQAIEWLRRALQQDPHHVQRRLLLADWLVRSHQAAEAQRWVAPLVSLFPERRDLRGILRSTEAAAEAQKPPPPPGSEEAASP